MFHMDSFCWLGLVVFCSLWIRALAMGMGRKLLSDMHGASPILMEMGYWDIVFCVWAIFAIFAILAIFMARSKNTRKGKAPSSSMERAVKKRKVDTSQTIKKGVKCTKDQQLYRTLVLSGHILLTFCIRIGTFDRLRVFGLV